LTFYPSVILSWSDVNLSLPAPPTLKMEENAFMLRLNGRWIF